MKKVAIGMMIMILMILSAACSQNQTIDIKDDQIEEIDFAENQLYAAAYLGYYGYEDLENLSQYSLKYDLDEDIPIHYFSQGEYYLVIPRYENTDLKLYKNDFNTMDSILVYEEKDMRPFVIQCNVSDIFSDVTVSLTYNDEEVSFSPYRSLKDGSVQVGERGKNITENSTIK